MSDKEVQKKSPVLVIILSVFLAAGGAAGAVVYLNGAHSHASDKAPEPKIAAILHLDTFTVNINDPEQKTFLRLGVDIGLERDPKSTKGSEATSLVRDTILSVLMSTKADDVSTSEGKQKLKDQLRVALQNRAPELGVREVYFTEFLLQR